MSCRQGSSVDVGRCTTRLENAHNTEFRELLYPWHPWSGLRIGIHEAIERPGGVVFRCDLTASDANRWLEIPAWMFDRSACAEVRLAVEPHTNLSALVMLGALSILRPHELDLHDRPLNFVKKGAKVGKCRIWMRHEDDLHIGSEAAAFDLAHGRRRAPRLQRAS